MSFSLYDATIPSYLQIIRATANLLERATDFCADQQLDHEQLLQAKLAEDMLPFNYQVRSVVTHSVGAIEGVRKGVFSPDLTPPPASFAELKQLVNDAIATLDTLTEQEINRFIGQDMRFEYGDYLLEFTAENFLLSFSQPNFYFHATTAYDLLRMKGLIIGKSDFMGSVRTQP